MNIPIVISDNEKLIVIAVASVASNNVCYCNVMETKTHNHF